MDADMLWGFFSLFLLLLIAGLLAHEWKEWNRNRDDARKRQTAQKRLFRRSIGAILLLVVVVLLRYPALGALSPRMAFLKILACLLICLFLIILAIWDARAVLKSLHADSVQDLRDQLSELQADGIGSSSTPPKSAGKPQATHEDP